MTFPVLTDEERKNRVILLHCTRCNAVTKHETIDKRGKPKKLIQYISPWRGAVNHQVYSARYRRRCKQCGHITQF